MEGAADSAVAEDRAAPAEPSEPVAHPGQPDSAAVPSEPAPASPDPRVDDALSRLAEVDSLPLTEQVEVFTDIHRRLAGVLADPDSQA